MTEVMKTRSEFQFQVKPGESGPIGVETFSPLAVEDDRKGRGLVGHDRKGRGLVEDALIGLLWIWLIEGDSNR